MKVNPKVALLALAIGAFAIGTTEFTPMGLLPVIADGVQVGIPTAGMLVTAYAVGVMLGAPVMTLLFGRFGKRAALMSLMVLFTVGNTMSTAVIERTVEIGTLRALGLRRDGIRRIFVCEGVLLGIAGAVLGVLLAAAVGGLVNHSGLTWTPPGRAPVPLIIRVWGEWALIGGTAAGLVVVAALSAWLPARRAARLQIVDALRHA